MASAMDIPVPLLEAGETNRSLIQIREKCVQGGRAFHLNLQEKEKKLILASLQHGKRAVATYYKERGDKTLVEEALKRTEAQLSTASSNITAQKLELARLQTLTVSKKAHLDVTQANTERMMQSARTTAVKQNQISTENVKLEAEAKSSKNEWGALLSKSNGLNDRFENLLANSPRMQSRDRENEAIESLRQRCSDLREENARLIKREKYVERQVASAKERGFVKFARNAAKFVIKEKANFAKCQQQKREMERILEKKAQRRAAGHIDPMDASFADFDETLPLSAPGSQKTGSQAEAAPTRADASDEQTIARKKSVSFAEPAVTAQKPAIVAMDVDDSAISSPSDSRSPSWSSLSSSGLNQVSPTHTKALSVTEPEPLRPVLSPQKKMEPVVAAPVSTPRAAPPSPVREATPEEDPVEDEVVEEPVEEDRMELETDKTASKEQEAMEVGAEDGSQSDSNQNNSFQFRMSPTGDNGLANLLNASQIQDNMDTDAVLNISTNSNHPGGDFLAMMQGDVDKNNDGGGADFSFGAMFGGSDNGNDAGGGGNDFPFDFGNAGSSPTGDGNASFGFNFGVGDSSSNNEGGDNGGFFFPF